MFDKFQRSHAMYDVSLYKYIQNCERKKKIVYRKTASAKVGTAEDNKQENTKKELSHLNPLTTINNRYNLACKPNKTCECFYFGSYKQRTL